METKQIIRAFEAAKRGGIHTLNQLLILSHLRNGGLQPISRFVEKLGLTSSAITGIADGLEKCRLIERVRTGNDRRMVYLQITASGLRLLNSMNLFPSI